MSKEFPNTIQVYHKSAVHRGIEGTELHIVHNDFDEGQKYVRFDIAEAENAELKKYHDYYSRKWDEVRAENAEIKSNLKYAQKFIMSIGKDTYNQYVRYMDENQQSNEQR